VPLVANFEGATMPNAVLLVTETGVEWWGRGDNEAHHLADLVLPDAEPGGVALVVEPLATPPPEDQQSRPRGGT
jgi:hypothetical protein